MRNDQDAEDMVQEAYLRAFKSFDNFYGVNARPWLLTIVRNTCYTLLAKNRTEGLAVSIEDELVDLEGPGPDPETFLLKRENKQLFKQVLEELPLEFREALILRELEELSYKEIAEIAGIPPGTVMSRLSRARARLKLLFLDRAKKEF